MRVQSVRGSHAEALGRPGSVDIECEHAPSSVVIGGAARPRWSSTLKRAIDLVAGVSLLLVTAPLSVVLAVLIKLEDGGPVLFRQSRVGRNGAVFTLRKFRSMRVDAERHTGPIWAQANDPRVTRVGRWMRPLGIDEIPQAWNVLCGEMSFVGPRPERPEFIAALEAAIPLYAQRHLVRPGITGWAQVNLPYGATVDDSRQKLACDLYYVRHANTRLDLTIMARTLRHIGRRQSA
jgi:lipopolysaccharide/colanic/teichoic acid biosynthesis glycosyltransferase